MKLIDHMPTSGQFIAVWENNGALWADTMRVKNGKTQMRETNGGWSDCDCAIFLKRKQAKFIVSEEA